MYVVALSDMKFVLFESWSSKMLCSFNTASASRSKCQKWRQTCGQNVHGETKLCILSVAKCADRLGPKHWSCFPHSNSLPMVHSAAS